MEIANGNENGIKYRVYLEAPNWVAEVTDKNGDVKKESWRWAFEPRCGADVCDINKAELVLDRMIGACI